MTTFAEIARKLEKVNINLIAKQIFSNPLIARQIIETITNRLYTKGITGDQVKLRTDEATISPASSQGFYSAFTEFEKLQKGDPVDRVTLKDLGTFYFSFTVKASTLYFQINADFNKPDGHIRENFTLIYSSEKSFEDSITSLSEKELQVILFAHFTNEITKRLQILLS